ncbi:MAG: oligopeptide transporter, OPT family [candidate division Zixibacteria bacterium]|nr:oligopeptide transporter, OPT family [candidate division Zixibacteria bacterium]
MTTQANPDGPAGSAGMTFPPEASAKAITLGIILAIVLAAANTYLGLKVGMTVSASIPAAVISMAILRGVLRSGSILENNIVQTIASTGESLAAGIIFTVPALVIAGVWGDFKFWETGLIALLGGTLGVMFMVPLRESLVIGDPELVYPEGVACSKVLEAGDTGGTGAKSLFQALGLGVAFKVLVSALSIIRSTVEGAFRIGQSIFYGGFDMSVSLIGVGYIVGPNIAIMVFGGSVLGWLIGIPIMSPNHPELASMSSLDAAWDLWDHNIRYMGVGAMAVSGVWSLIKVRASIVHGLKAVGAAYEKVSGHLAVDRTALTMTKREVSVIMLLTMIPMFFLYAFLVHSFAIAALTTIIMVIAAFLLVSVAAYICGVVGSSNSPVSGMTITAVLFTAAILLGFGLKGTMGIIATLGVAGVVCCAVCTAGDISQDLKTGFLVGATPRKQQWVELLGVLAPAFTFAWVLSLLHNAWGIGTGEPGSLGAPQASLFASLTSAMFTDAHLPWNMVWIGSLVAVGIIVIDEVLRKRTKFRAYPMPVAVGIYLPFGTTSGLFLGGMIAWVMRLLTRKRGPEATERAQTRGTLLSSGLIAGEALTGIGLAVAITSGANLPITIIDSDLLSLGIYLLMGLYVLQVSLKAARR